MARPIAFISGGILLAASLSRLAAQEPSKGAPYLGVISGNEVFLRTGGSRNHLSFASVKMGQRIIVDREVDEWCKVYLPRWIPVYVHKDYVDLRGSKAVVKAGELNLRVAPQRQSADQVLATLPRGSEIEIIGKEGDWLKAVPPAGTFAFVNKRYITRERDLSPADVKTQLAQLREGGEPGAAIQLAKKSKSPEKGPGKSLERAVPSASPAEARLISTSLKKADDLYQAIRIRSPKERDYTAVRAIYQDVVDSSEDRTEISAAEKALKFLGEQEERDKALVDAQQSVADVERKNRQIKDQARGISTTRRLVPVDPDPYLARGWVSGMALMSGQSATHRLMKGSQVLYFLQSEEGSTISLDSYLNRRVGVKGVVRELDPKFGANLIIVKEIVVFTDR